MVRWEPGTRERLQGAALELFARQGYDETTAAQIAASEGVTERTFFRHFADKREVLFDGQERLSALVVDAVSDAPDDEPLVVVLHAVRAAGSFFPAERRGFSRMRQRVVEATPPLQERELLKMASLAVGVAAALHRRGTPEPQATLAAEAGIAVFGVAFAQWVADGEEREFADLVTSVSATLTRMAAAATST